MKTRKAIETDMETINITKLKYYTKINMKKKSDKIKDGIDQYHLERLNNLYHVYANKNIGILNKRHIFDNKEKYFQVFIIAHQISIVVLHEQVDQWLEQIMYNVSNK